MTTLIIKNLETAKRSEQSVNLSNKDNQEKTTEDDPRRSYSVNLGNIQT